MATRIDQDKFRDMVESGEIQLSDLLPQDYGYIGNIDEDSEFYTPYTMRSRPGILSVYDRITGPIKNVFQRYGAPVMGGLMSAFTGIPGIGFLMRNMPNDPYAQNRIDMYGAYRGADGFIKDKFGYNVGNTLLKNNFMQPGSSSYRSYALEGLRSLDKQKADDYYQDTYGKSFDEVKQDIQQKKDPFGSGSVIDMGADYQGGGDNQSFNEGPVGNNAGGAQLGSGMSTGQHSAFRRARGGIVSL